MRPAPLPDLSRLSHVQLVEMAQILHASLVEVFQFVDSLEEQIRCLERRMENK